MRRILGRDSEGRVTDITVAETGILGAGGGSTHPDRAAHVDLGLAARDHAHDYADPDHSHDVPAHEHDYAEPHDHPYAVPHDHPYASDAHTHAATPHPDLATHTALGLATAHAHPYAASGHNHDGTYAVPHSHDFSATNHGHDGLYASAGHTHAAASPTYALLANGATAMDFATNSAVKVTPTANATYTTTVPAAGHVRHLIVLTSGTTSRTITFGSGFKPTATLATGTTTARVFVLTFVSDGANLYEASRTVAMPA